MKYTAASALLLVFSCATPVFSAEPDFGQILTTCHDVTRRALAVAAVAKTQNLAPWSREELAHVPPVTVVGGVPLGQDKPMANPPKVALKSDVVRGWWVDPGHTISLVYQEATQARGRPGLSPSTAERWRSCHVSGHVMDARALIVAALSLEKEPDAFLNQSGRLGITISAPFKFTPLRPVPELPSMLVLTFDNQMVFSGDFLAPSARPQFLKAVAHSSAFEFQSETYFSIP